jgi:hypothetical protein
VDTKKEEPGGSPAPPEKQDAVFYWAQVLEPPTTLHGSSGEVMSAQAVAKAAAAMTRRARMERRMIYLGARWLVDTPRSYPPIM